MNVVMGNFGNKSLLLLSLGRREEDLIDFSLKKECGCYLDFFILLKPYSVDACTSETATLKLLFG